MYAAHEDRVADHENGQLSYFNNLQYKLIGHRAGGGTFSDGVARNYNYTYPDVHQVKFTLPVHGKFLVDLATSRFRADDVFRPRARGGERCDLEDTTYNGADFTLNKRMSHGWSFIDGLAINRTTGDTHTAAVASTGQPAGDLNNPNLTFRNGIVGNDSSYSAAFRMCTTCLYAISASGTFRTIEPRLDLYNLANAATILARTTQLGPTYGRASSIQRGTLMKAGYDVSF